MTADAAAGGLRFHHVGLVVPALGPATDYHRDVLGYTARGGVEEDPVQKVRIQFMALGDFLVELIEPVGEDSPVRKFLAGGGGLQHICYECDDIAAALDRLKRAGGGVACPPVPAPAIEGRRVAFFINRHRQLIELVEV